MEHLTSNGAAHCLWPSVNTMLASPRPRLCPPGQTEAPTLIVSAEDDLLRTLNGARFTAAHIPRAKLQILKCGGHLMLGQGRKVRSWIADFLARSRQWHQRKTADCARQLRVPAGAPT